MPRAASGIEGSAQRDPELRARCRARGRHMQRRTAKAAQAQKAEKRRPDARLAAFARLLARHAADAGLPEGIAREAERRQFSGNARRRCARGPAMTRVALYARYSSDKQREASIEDQIRLCEERAAREGWKVVQHYTDHAISGASLMRPGIQALMQDAQGQEIRSRPDGIARSHLARSGRHRRSLQAPALCRRADSDALRRAGQRASHRLQGHDGRAVSQGPCRQDAPRPARARRGRQVGRRQLLRLRRGDEIHHGGRARARGPPDQ